MHIKNNEDPRLLAHKHAVEAERRNKAMARNAVAKALTPWEKVAAATRPVEAKRPVEFAPVTLAPVTRVRFVNGRAI